MREYSRAQPAFPCEVDPDRLDAGSHQTGHAVFAQYGMTLRDYFAAKAMQGLLAQSCGTAFGSDPIHGAQYAYQMADAMLAAREKQP